MQTRDQHIDSEPILPHLGRQPCPPAGKRCSEAGLRSMPPLIQRWVKNRAGKLDAACADRTKVSLLACILHELLEAQPQDGQSGTQQITNSKNKVYGHAERAPTTLVGDCHSAERCHSAWT